MDFTLLVTIHNRTSYLEKLVSSYKDTPFPIFYADSSDTPCVVTMRPGYTASAFPGKNFYQKMVDSLSSIKTKFVCWLNDDDFIYIDAIKQCVDFLENHESYVSCLGLQRKTGQSNYGVSHYRQFIADDFHHKRPTTRICYLFRYFHSRVHAVYRKDILLEAFSLILNNRHLWPIRFSDKIIDFVTGIYGNTKVLPLLYSTRSADRLINQGGYPKYLEKNVKFPEILARLKQENPLANLLESKSHLNLDQAKQFTYQTLSTYIKNGGKPMRSNDHVPLPS